MVNWIWHTKPIDQILKHFNASMAGLSGPEVVELRQKYGPNSLPEAKPESLAMIFLRQFKSPLIYILVIAGILIYFTGENTDAIIIFFILVFNALVGTIQEGRAQRTLSSLKKLVETKAVVLRNNIEEIIPDIEVVPGDILVLREGDKIPADARLITVHSLAVDESSLTGESQPVYKSESLSKIANLPTAEQKNMVFKGTNVVAGAGTAVVVATGVETVIGKISEKIATIESEDPIRRDIRKLSRTIIVVAALTCVTLFTAGLVSGKTLSEMFATVVSLAVSIIPEGLPIVLTLVLATGVWRMSKKNALVKKLQAVESLGQAKIIAVDKTGTITRNELTIAEIYVDGKTYTVSGSGYEPSGQILLLGQALSDPPAGVTLLAKSAALCSSAQVAFSEEKQLWQVSGDPTEAALVVFGQKLGYRKEALEEDMPQIEEMPFSSATKYHAVVHKNNSGQEILTVIGAPEAVLDSSSSLWQEKKNIHLAKAEKEQLEQTVTDISKQGLRVLGVATKLINQRRADGVVEVDNLTFIGFVGMKDALREEVKDALTKTREAGMKVVMITGDHKLTAQAIAEEAGIFTEGNKVLTGVEIESLTDAGLAQAVENVSVYARVTPDHKLRIIQAYKSRGEIIAMTGDGVNDAPSLVAADLGVAMGRGGTEVAKEAADIVLLDDNFGNIAAAVEEGRSIYKTIRKVILYLFSTGLGETLAIAFAIFLDLPLPVLASQIIWLNFVTDGFLDVSLAMEPKEPGLLREPRSTTTSFLDFSMVRRMFLMALPMAIGSLWLFSRYLDGDMTKALTMSMTVLAVFQWFNAWNCRSEKKSVFRIGFSSNKYLLAATFIVVALQLLAVYHPFLQRFLHTTALTLGEWVIILIVASSVILVEELRKLWVRSKDL